MKYSQVIHDFYSIDLPEESTLLVDVHFTAAAHHFNRSNEDNLDVIQDFHKHRYYKHLQNLFNTVYINGDFASAIDPSLQGAEMRSSWDPDSFIIFDSYMFSRMNADIRFLAGHEHPNDTYLTIPNERSFQ